MICSNCGNNNPDNTSTCYFCGSRLPSVPNAYPAAQPQSYRPVYSKPTIPPGYEPISAWGYYGYQLLFSIPLVGFIMLIVFSCGGTSNVNLKNYARSYWCAYLVWFIICIIVVVLLLAAGVALEDVLYDLL